MVSSAYGRVGATPFVFLMPPDRKRCLSLFKHVDGADLYAWLRREVQNFATPKEQNLPGTCNRYTSGGLETSVVQLSSGAESMSTGLNDLARGVMLLPYLA